MSAFKLSLEIFLFPHPRPRRGDGRPVRIPAPSFTCRLVSARFGRKQWTETADLPRLFKLPECVVLQGYISRLLCTVRRGGGKVPGGKLPILDIPLIWRNLHRRTFPFPIYKPSVHPMLHGTRGGETYSAMIRLTMSLSNGVAPAIVFVVGRSSGRYVSEFLPPIVRILGEATLEQQSSQVSISALIARSRSLRTVELCLPSGRCSG